jgi:transposase
LPLAITVEQEDETMDVLYPRCAGIDVHKATAVVTVGWRDERGQRRTETRTFATTTPAIEHLVAWLVVERVTHVAMESTGPYWKPLFNLLEPHVTVVLANPAHVKAVPGRKSDVRDSEWLLDLMQHGLIQASFVPEAPIRALRDLTRYRTTIIEERTREANRIQKVLEDANIKLASVASDVLGVSGRAMLEAIVAGETDPERLAGLAVGHLRKKHAALVEALTGRVQPHHRFLLNTLLAHVSYLDQLITELSDELTRRLEPYAAALTLLCSITGVKQRAAEVIVAEIGVDMDRFVDARHLCSWAALCPGSDESAGKRRSSRVRHGNRWLKTVLVQGAWGVTKAKDSYLAAQFRRITRRRGPKRAVIAVAHSLLTIIYHVLKNGVFYQDLGADYFDRRRPEQHAQYHVRRLSELGFDVTLTPAAAD